jgi:hypothetical protein
LSVTVAIGAAEAALLMRLSRDAALQQRHLEGLIQNQQSMLSTLLDTHPVTVISPPAVVPAAAPAIAAPPPPVAPVRHTAKAHHAHKPRRPDAH